MRTLLVLGCGLLLAACGGGSDTTTGSDTSTTTTTTATAASPDACQDVQAPDPKPDGGRTAPSEQLNPSVSYVLVFETSCGDFEVTLDQEAAPNTAASLVALTQSGFYDGTIVHRVFPGFVVQGGDPTGKGSGGPGYSTVDKPPADAAYTLGTVAMAKTEVEPPGTSGSQFFVVTGDDAGLSPDYAIVGEVSKGLDTIRRIEALGDVSTQLPSQPVVVERVTVRET